MNRHLAAHAYPYGGHAPPGYMRPFGPPFPPVVRKRTSSHYFQFSAQEKKAPDDFDPDHEQAKSDMKKRAAQYVRIYNEAQLKARQTTTNTKRQDFDDIGSTLSRNEEQRTGIYASRIPDTNKSTPQQNRLSVSYTHVTNPTKGMFDTLGAEEPLSPLDLPRDFDSLNQSMQKTPNKLLTEDAQLQLNKVPVEVNSNMQYVQELVFGIGEDSSIDQDHQRSDALKQAPNAHAVDMDALQQQQDYPADAVKAPEQPRAPVPANMNEQQTQRMQMTDTNMQHTATAPQKQNELGREYRQEVEGAPRPLNPEAHAIKRSGNMNQQQVSENKQQQSSSLSAAKKEEVRSREQTEMQGGQKHTEKTSELVHAKAHTQTTSSQQQRATNQEKQEQTSSHSKKTQESRHRQDNAASNVIVRQKDTESKKEEERERLHRGQDNQRQVDRQEVHQTRSNEHKMSARVTNDVAGNDSAKRLSLGASKQKVPSALKRDLDEDEYVRRQELAQREEFLKDKIAKDNMKRLEAAAAQKLGVMPVSPYNQRFKDLNMPDSDFDEDEMQAARQASPGQKQSQTALAAIKNAERVAQAAYGGTLDTGEVRRQRLERGKKLSSAFEHQSQLQAIANSPRFRKKGLAAQLGYEPQAADTKKPRYSSPYAAKNLGVKRTTNKSPIKTFQQSQALRSTQPKPMTSIYQRNLNADLANSNDGAFENRNSDGMFRSQSQASEDEQKVEYGGFFAPQPQKKKVTGKKKAKSRSPSPGLRKKRAQLMMAQTMDAYQPISADIDIYKQDNTKSALEIAQKRNSLSGKSKFDLFPFQYNQQSNSNDRNSGGQRNADQNRDARTRGLQNSLKNSKDKQMSSSTGLKRRSDQTNSNNQSKLNEKRQQDNRKDKQASKKQNSGSGDSEEDANKFSDQDHSSQSQSSQSPTRDNKESKFNRDSKNSREQQNQKNSQKTSSATGKKQTQGNSRDNSSSFNGTKKTFGEKNNSNSLRNNKQVSKGAGGKERSTSSRRDKQTNGKYNSKATDQVDSLNKKKDGKNTSNKDDGLKKRHSQDEDQKGKFNREHESSSTNKKPKMQAGYVEPRAAKLLDANNASQANTSRGGANNDTKKNNGDQTGNKNLTNKTHQTSQSNSNFGNSNQNAGNNDQNSTQKSSMNQKFNNQQQRNQQDGRDGNDKDGKSTNNLSDLTQRNTSKNSKEEQQRLQQLSQMKQGGGGVNGSAGPGSANSANNKNGGQNSDLINNYSKKNSNMEDFERDNIGADFAGGKNAVYGQMAGMQQYGENMNKKNITKVHEFAGENSFSSNLQQQDAFKNQVGKQMKQNLDMESILSQGRTQSLVDSQGYDQSGVANYQQKSDDVLVSHKKPLSHLLYQGNSSHVQNQSLQQMQSSPMNFKQNTMDIAGSMGKWQTAKKAEYRVIDADMVRFESQRNAAAQRQYELLEQEVVSAALANKKRQQGQSRISEAVVYRDINEADLVRTSEVHTINQEMTVNYQDSVEIQPAREREIEMIINVHLADKGTVPLYVHSDDNPEQCVKEFCEVHRISDPEKQRKLAYTVCKQWTEHRYGFSEQQQTVVQQRQVAAPMSLHSQSISYELTTKQRNTLDPVVERKVLEIFNDVWYDFDVEEGHVSRPQFKQIMNYCKMHTKHKVKGDEHDPFKDATLDKVFDEEYKSKYLGEERIVGKISHRAVLHYACEVFSTAKRRKDEKQERLAELQRVRHEVTALRELKADQQRRVTLVEVPTSQIQKMATVEYSPEPVYVPQQSAPRPRFFTYQRPVANEMVFEEPEVHISPRRQTVVEQMPATPSQISTGNFNSSTNLKIVEKNEVQPSYAPQPKVAQSVKNAATRKYQAPFQTNRGDLNESLIHQAEQSPMSQFNGMSEVKTHKQVRQFNVADVPVNPWNKAYKKTKNYLRVTK